MILLIIGGAAVLLFVLGKRAQAIAADEQGLVLSGHFTPDPDIVFTPRREHGGDMVQIHQNVPPPHRTVYTGR